MKKRIIVFVVFSLLCLALVGCVQRNDETNGSVDANESSQIEGSDASSDDDVDVFDDSYDADLSGETDLSETNESEDIGDGGESSADGGGYTRNADGSYTWQVGYYELTTTINVWDYIDGDVWNVQRMASDLGYEPIETPYYVSVLHYKNDATPQVDFELIQRDYCNGIRFNKATDSQLTGFIVAYRRDYGKEYHIDRLDEVISFDLIVACAYTCEQLNVDPYTDPLDEMIDRQGGDTHCLNYTIGY